MDDVTALRAEVARLEAENRVLVDLVADLQGQLGGCEGGDGCTCSPVAEAEWITREAS
jgi:hypothetical protein